MDNKKPIKEGLSCRPTYVQGRCHEIMNEKEKQSRKDAKARRKEEGTIVNEQ